MKNNRTYHELENELEALKSRLEEAEETLRAIGNNEVDALVVEGPQGQQIFTLQGAERPYRTLMETMSEGALTVAQDGTILYCNSRFSELIGRPLNRIIGVSLSHFVIPRDGPSFTAMLTECEREGCKRNFFLATADGEEVPVLLSMRPLPLDHEGAFCIAATDLTEQKKIQNELENAREHLEEMVAERTRQLSQANEALQKEMRERKQAEKALQKALDSLELRVQERTAQLSDAYENLQKGMEERRQLEDQIRQTQKLEAMGTLAGGIAHDFNNILAGIIGFTEMVLEDVNPEGPEHRRLELVLRGANRGRDLVKQILAFSRHSEQNRTACVLSQTVGEGLKFLRSTLPSTIEIISKRLTDDDLIMADPVQMQQILTNLCTNAAHAMQEKGGTLEINVSAISFTEGDPAPVSEIVPGEYVVLEVRDTGCGMNPGTLERIFDPFFTTKEPGEGTGLGLSVVHGIVKSHAGYITAASEPGKGAVFHVYFPKSKEPSPPDDEEAPSASGGKGRILLVDDEDILVELNQQRLTRFGYEVTATTSSAEALDIFQREPDTFDLVITDQTMPHMTGMDLAAELLHIRPAIPIILCTGHSETVSSEQAEQTGIRTFLMKPIAKQELAQAIRRVLEEKR